MMMMRTRSLPLTSASLSDEDISAICKVIIRPGGLVGKRMPDRRNQISVLVTKNLKLVTFMFKMMEHHSKPYNIFHVDIRALLSY